MSELKKLLQEELAKLTKELGELKAGDNEYLKTALETDIERIKWCLEQIG